MKVVKIVIGILAGLYALAQCVQLTSMLIKGAHSSAIMGSVAGLCIGAAICYALLKSAFKKAEE